MRNYGKIEAGFWQNKKVRKLSDAGKLLLIYIYTCPHGNSIGCFVLPRGYIAEDLGWVTEHVTERVSELVSKGFIEHDSDNNLVRIVGWFDHNTIENENVAKAAIATICGLPDSELLQRFFKELLDFNNKFLNRFYNTLCNAFPNTWPNPEPSLAEPNLTITKPTAGVGVTRASPAAQPAASEQKSFLEKNDFDAAVRCCCSILGKRTLSVVDQEYLTTWCMAYDFEGKLRPLLYEKLEKFMKKNPGKRPVSLSYFAEAIQEKLA